MGRKILEELCYIEIGKTPSRSCSKFWDEKCTTNNTWVSIADLNNTQNKKVFSSKEQISDLAIQHMKLVKEGTLLLSFKLTIGRVAFAGKDLYTNEAIAQLPIKNEQKIDKHYLYYYFQYFDYDELLKGDVKVKGKTLNKGKLKVLPVCYPPLPEQERIVGILDKAFDAIDKVKANAEQTLTHAKELFDNTLDAQITTLYKNSSTQKLSEVCDVRDGTHDSPKYLDKGGHPFVTSKNLKNDKIDMEKITYISDFDFEKINERSKVDIGDVLFAMIGTIGNPVVIIEEPNFAIKNVALFKNINKLDPQYLKFLLKSPSVLLKMQLEANGTTQKFVSLKYLRNFMVPVPSISEQQKIVEKIDSLQEQIRKLEQIYTQKIKECDELKQSILQKAFRGEL
jgi:type I restriction enzyme S subunit